jgi:hypothetical protein
MKTLTLSKKLENISKKIQPKVFSAIANTIIAKSLENGSFIEELSLYITKEDLEDFIAKNDINIKITKKQQVKKTNKNEFKDNYQKEKNPFFGIED